MDWAMLDGALYDLETAVGNGDEPARMVLRDLIEQTGAPSARRFPWRKIVPGPGVLDNLVPLDGTQFMTMEVLVPRGSNGRRCKIDFLVDVMRYESGQWMRGPIAMLALSDHDIAQRHWMTMADWRAAWDRRPSWRDARRDRLVVFMHHGTSYPIVQCAWFADGGWQGPSGPISNGKFEHTDRATWCEAIEFLP